VRNRKLLVGLAVALGIALTVVAVVYWAEPARSLPSFFPGHEAGSNHHHVKHGIASLLVGLACFAFAWFNTGPKKSRGATPDAG
jgi:ABC-type nickel/cobalt efflux system permease component RcnA